MIDGLRFVLRFAALRPILLVVLLALGGFLPEHGHDAHVGSCSTAWTAHRTSCFVRAFTDVELSGLKAFAARPASTVDAAPGTPEPSSLRGELPDDDDDAGGEAESTSQELLGHTVLDTHLVPVDEFPAFRGWLVATPIRAPPLG